MTDRDLIARIRGYIGKASFATEADRYTVTTLLDELAAVLAREQEAQPAPSEADMPAICAALGFDPTNHHNAAKCPYCRPAALDSEGEPMKLCTVCGSPVRYGSRHSQCGEAIEQAIRAAQPAAQEPSDDQNT